MLLTTEQNLRSWSKERKHRKEVLISNTILRIKFAEELLTVNTKENISHNLKTGINGETTA